MKHLLSIILLSVSYLGIGQNTKPKPNCYCFSKIDSVIVYNNATVLIYKSDYSNSPKIIRDTLVKETILNVDTIGVMIVEDKSLMLKRKPRKTS